MHATWIIGIVGVLVATAAVAIVRTRWLQSRTLEKCVGLSILLHAVLGAVCALLGGLAPASWGTQEDGRMTMVVLLSDDDEVVAAPDETADLPDDEASEVPVPDADAPPAVAPDGEAAASALVAAPLREVSQPPGDLVPLLDDPDATIPASDASEVPAIAAARETAEIEAQSPSDTPSPKPFPAVYADRQGARRAAAAAARGGSEATERAVQAALGWLARSQSSDGCWDAARHGAGKGRPLAGQHDGSVGARSDTGVTGLALLAFLGAGTTHRDGPHVEEVRRGIRFLVDGQRADGSLAGSAEFFAALYCHGMATLALAECHALSGDMALRQPLERAVRYTLSTQHPATGGWRYAPGDRGDTSQLGWQVMVLASSRQAGLTGFEGAEAGAREFLRSVSSGGVGGLAGYRPGERPSVAMTAEALVCRLFLGMPVDHPVAIEGLDMISRHPPDARRPNAYTWYYATLASFHCGGSQWEGWNQHLQAALLPLQHREAGPLEGSWDPDAVWGGHGGRVYATALSAMTLEVYYRHLPLHQRAGRVAAVP